MIKNYNFIKNKLNFKIALFCTILLISLLSTKTYSQCAVPTIGCSNTNLANYGSNSNLNSATIEYDNFVSSFHSTVARTGDGTLQLWGEKLSNSGAANVLSPTQMNVANYPALGTATPLKMYVASNWVSTVQGIVLATDGLYAWATEGTVLDNAITSSSVFQKLTIDGNTNGLPPGIVPADVKMMFVTYQTIALTTCNGDVWVISLNNNLRGNGGVGLTTRWYQVTTNEVGNPPLTNVVATRGSAGALMALKSDGSVYVWGNNVYLGNNTPVIATQNRAVQMTLPAGITPKMIGSGNNLGNNRSFYILATDGNLFALGKNNVRQLGDWTTVDRLSWVQPRYTSAAGPVMSDVIWISPQEHDTYYNGFNLINSAKTLYAFGENNNSMLSTATDPLDPFIPSGVVASDAILAVETGGHTSMIIKQCQTNFGYVGHKISGSMGNGSAASGTENSYTFATTPIVICGAGNPEILVSISPSGPTSGYCIGSSALLAVSPIGGTISIASGPATLVGNTITFTGLGSVVVQYDILDPCGVLRVATTTLTTEYCPTDLSITKTVSNPSPIVGSNVTFTITATNNGTYDAYGVVVNDVLPTGYTIVGSPTLSTGTWLAPNWTIGTLANGASQTMTITGTVLATGSYANTANITGVAPDSIPANNTSTSTPVPCAPTPTVSAVTQPTCATATGSFTITNYNAAYTYVVTPSTGVTVSGNSVTAPAGTYNVTASLGLCTSVASSDVVINAQPATPAAPTVGTITQPTCALATGSVVLSGLPSGNWTINPGGITGNTATTTISGLASGTYTYTVTNSVGCISVASSDVVMSNLICATDDNFIGTPVAVGGSTPTVVTNDTLNGVGPVVIGTNPGEVTLTGITVPSGLTLNPNGTITVNANTPSGTYSVVYEICEVGATPTPPGNCDQATATVVVNNPIVATDDNFSGTPVAVGGSTPTVVTNDTLNGVDPVVIGTNPGEVTLTGITVPSGLTLNPNGTITVNANTPSGTYSVVYEICEVGATPTPPGNCDQATATVVVLNPIDAVNDTAQVVEINVTGPVLAGNVLGNDTLNSILVTTTNTDVTPSTQGPLSIDALGSVTIAPGTPAGTYTIVYELCEVNPVTGLPVSPTNCDTATATFIVVTDSDGDGVTNIDEINDGTDPNNNCDFTPSSVTEEQSQEFLDGDCDGDGLTNGEEYGPDPTNPLDSDGDGIPDYLEFNTHNGTDDLEIFQMVTPNGDNDNDVFVIKNIERFPNNTVEIYNRWGVLVYEVKGYNPSEGKAFKGISEGRVTVNQSSELPVGTYFYIIKYTNDATGENKEQAGYLYINR